MPAASSASAPDGGELLALAAAVVVGGCVALQQRVNGQLDGALGDPLLVGVVGFAICLLLSAGVVLGRPISRQRFAQLHRLPPWQLLGGLGGATLVAIGASAAPSLGVALLTVVLVFGQTTGGVVLDRLGIGPGGRRAMTGPRIGGAILCLVAVVVAGLAGAAARADPMLVALVAVAGVGASCQQALNGRAQVATGDTPATTLVNYLSGSFALSIAFAGHALLAGRRTAHWPGPGQWYLYLGGPLGACFVAVAAVTVHRLGVLRLGLATVAGQLTGAVALDVVVPSRGTTLSMFTVAGALLTLVAVLVSGRAPGRSPLLVRT